MSTPGIPPSRFDPSLHDEPTNPQEEEGAHPQEPEPGASSSFSLAATPPPAEPVGPNPHTVTEQYRIIYARRLQRLGLGDGDNIKVFASYLAAWGINYWAGLEQKPQSPTAELPNEIIALTQFGLIKEIEPESGKTKFSRQQVERLLKIAQVFAWIGENEPSAAQEGFAKVNERAKYIVNTWMPIPRRTKREKFGYKGGPIPEAFLASMLASIKKAAAEAFTATVQDEDRGIKDFVGFAEVYSTNVFAGTKGFIRFPRVLDDLLLQIADPAVSPVSMKKIVEAWQKLYGNLPDALKVYNRLYGGLSETVKIYLEMSPLYVQQYIVHYLIDKIRMEIKNGGSSTSDQIVDIFLRLIYHDDLRKKIASDVKIHNTVYGNDGSSTSDQIVDIFSQLYMNEDFREKIASNAKGHNRVYGREAPYPLIQITQSDDIELMESISSYLNTVSDKASDKSIDFLMVAHGINVALGSSWATEGRIDQLTNYAIHLAIKEWNSLPYEHRRFFLIRTLKPMISTADHLPLLFVDVFIERALPQRIAFLKSVWAQLPNKLAQSFGEPLSSDRYPQRFIDFMLTVTDVTDINEIVGRAREYLGIQSGGTPTAAEGGQDAGGSQSVDGGSSPDSSGLASFIPAAPVALATTPAPQTGIITLDVFDYLRSGSGFVSLRGDIKIETMAQAILFLWRLHLVQSRPNVILNSLKDPELIPSPDFIKEKAKELKGRGVVSATALTMNMDEFSRTINLTSMSYDDQIRDYLVRLGWSGFSRSFLSLRDYPEKRLVDLPVTLMDLFDREFIPLKVAELIKVWAEMPDNLRESFGEPKPGDPYPQLYIDYMISISNGTPPSGNAPPAAEGGQGTGGSQPVGKGSSSDSSDLTSTYDEQIIATDNAVPENAVPGGNNAIGAGFGVYMGAVKTMGWAITALPH